MPWCRSSDVRVLLCRRVGVFAQPIRPNHVPLLGLLAKPPLAEPPKPTTTLPTTQQATPLSKDLEKHISRSLGVPISSEAPGAAAAALSMHPYEHEINNFLYSEDQMKACTERPPRSLEVHCSHCNALTLACRTRR